MKTVKAFAPGNVSCVFKIVPHEDPRKMHSLGMGFTVNEGAVVQVREDAETAVSFNGRGIDFPTVKSVAAGLTDKSLRVEIESSLPLGSGFGLSGASAIATAYAVNALLDLGRTPEELAMTAHVAEVENLTGLGDVCAQFHGGCLAKLRPGNPLAAVPLPVSEQVVYCRYFGPIETRRVLSNAEQKARINTAADKALAAIADLRDSGEDDFDRYIEVSKTFAEESGLLTDSRVRETIRRIEDAGGHASMIMLGQAVFSTVEFEGARRLRLTKTNARVV